MADTHTYVIIKGFSKDSPIGREAQQLVDAANERFGRDGTVRPDGVSQSPVKSLREWREFLGDPPTLPHPRTLEPIPVPLDRFEDHDEDELFLTLSLFEPDPARIAGMNLPPPGEPIIELE